MSRGSNPPIRRAATPTPPPVVANPAPGGVGVTLHKLWLFPKSLQWTEHEPPRVTANGFSVDCRIVMRPELRIEYVVVAEVTFHRTGIYAAYMTATRTGTEIQCMTKEDRLLLARETDTQTIIFEQFTGPLAPEFTVRFERVADLPPTIYEIPEGAKTAVEAVKAEGELARDGKDGDAKP